MVFIILFILFILFYRKNKENFSTLTHYDILIQNTTHVPHLCIPKKIWAFWDGDELPPVVQLCIQSWKVKNPSYSVIILSKKTLKEYLPEVDFAKMKHINSSVTKFSDMVRLCILEKYGGIWCDASIICIEPFDSWLVRLDNTFDFIGFYIDSFTLSHFKHFSPVIENWFFACPPNSLFIKDWLSEFSRISSFERVGEYVNNVQNDNVNTQKISGLEYLSMHVACQKILQKNLGKYNIALFKAEDSALKYLSDQDWDTQKSIHNIANCALKNIKKPELLVPIIKLRSPERNLMSTMPNHEQKYIFKFL